MVEKFMRPFINVIAGFYPEGVLWLHFLHSNLLAAKTLRIHKKNFSFVIISYNNKQWRPKETIDMTRILKVLSYY